jgi:membrane protein
VLVLGLGLLYRYGPNMRGDRLAWFTPGAGVVVVCWFAMSALFSTYVANFSNYNEVYGSIGAVIALLMWFYLSSYLVLLGAALNMALRRFRGADGAQG